MRGYTNGQMDRLMDRWIEDGRTHSSQELKAPYKQTFDSLGPVLTKGIGI